MSPKSSYERLSAQDSSFIISRRADPGQCFEAFSAGYESGKQSQPLFGADWNALWAVPLEEVRQRFAISLERRVGEGIRTAA